MSPVLTAPVEAPPSPPERPGYFAVAGATFLGYFFTVILALPVVLAATYAGVDLVDVTNSVGRGAFYRYDAWSWAAETCVALLAVGLTALMVGHQLRTRTGWEVTFGFAFLTLLVTGYAPVLALTPLYGATGVVSLAIAAFVLRRRAAPSGAEPRTALGQVPSRFRRPVAIALAVGVPLMVAYVFGYAATHPLRFDAEVNDKQVYERHAGAIERYSFEIRTLGAAEVSDLAIVRAEGSPALQLERVGEVGSYPDRITLELRQGPLCPERVARLDAVWMRYTVLGMRHEQRIPLVDGPSVRCR